VTAARVRRPPDPARRAERQAARQAAIREQIRQAAIELAATAPPLGPQQRARLRALLDLSGGHDESG
jgi:hypothetical protein